jgi:hypothetical protein
MNTQCPFESFRRLLKSAANRLITATLAIATACLLSLSSAHAQEPYNNFNDCTSAIEVDEANLNLPPVPTLSSFGGSRFPGYSVGYLLSTFGSVLSSMYSYIPAPPLEINEPQKPQATIGGNAQPGPCSVATASTVPRR